MKQLLLSRAALVLAGVALAACQSVDTGHHDRFAEADANHDGNLTLDEANTYLVTDAFKSYDKNHDGKLAKDEWGGPDHEKEVGKRDANHDDLVTLDEVKAYGRKSGSAARLMKAADKDKNGSLSRAEVTEYYAKREGPPR